MKPLTEEILQLSIKYSRKAFGRCDRLYDFMVCKTCDDELKCLKEIDHEKDKKK
jgi:hypothetical protein